MILGNATQRNPIRVKSDVVAAEDSFLSTWSPSESSELEPRLPVIKPNLNLSKVYTPSSQSQNAGQTPTSRTYAAREKSGEVLFRYNCKNFDEWIPKLEEDEVSIKRIGDKFPGSGEDFKYLHQRSSEVTLSLDRYMNEIGYQIIEDFSLLDKGPEDLSQTFALESVVFIGRIKDDGTKLTQDSTFFEGSLQTSKGHVVQLDLAKLDEYYLFPGQVLGLEGKNSMGKVVNVEKIYKPIPLPRQSLDLYQEEGILNMIIAAGPFTTKDSLKYEPLADLGRVVQDIKPQVCVLIGPFLDANHPFILDDDPEYQISQTYEEIFYKQIEKFAQSVKSVGTEIILISSFKDVFHHNVYPTPPYNGLQRLKESVTCLPDPAMISFNGVTFGFTSTDILMHLSRNELAVASMGTDRMGRLCRHILSQRNFYPLSPQDESVPLDFNFWSKYSQMTQSPHVLVLPSELRYFVKDIDGTVVLNPERLTKGISGGTYAKIQIDLNAKSKSSDTIADYIISEIVKI